MDVITRSKVVFSFEKMPLSSFSLAKKSEATNLFPIKTLIENYSDRPHIYFG